MSNPQSIPYLRLGVNIDHVATIRNARGGRHPVRNSFWPSQPALR